MAESSDESRLNRLKTNVIDYRPITAPLTSPRVFSRPSSPSSIKSPKFAKEEIYRSFLDKTEFDMGKLIEDLPTYLRHDKSNNNISLKKEIANAFRESPPGSEGTRLKTSGEIGKGRVASNSNYSSLLAPRPLSRGTSNHFSGTSTPSSSRREENSLDLHTKRIGFHLTSSGKNTSYSKTAEQSKSIGTNSRRPSGVSMSVPSTPTTVAANNHRMKRGEVCSPNATKSNIRSGASTAHKLGTLPKRLCTAEAEKENPCSSKKDVFLKHVYVVNGSVVAFKSFGYENFTNWFGDEAMLSKEKKLYDFFHRELDVWGFTNREITMKLFCGNKLLVEANRLARGKLPAKKFKETIILPNHLSVESLIICRARSGRLIIQELPSSYLPTGN